MKNMAKSALVFALSCLMVVASFLVSADVSLADSSRCFWMENYSGNYNWVDAPQGNISAQECYSLDSCSGGLGQSSGGCYKWATSADSPGVPWDCFGFAGGSPRCFWMENYSGNYNWVDAPQGDISKQECYGLDSCDGGEGLSGGGCYKWAMGANCPRIPWN